MEQLADIETFKERQNIVLEGFDPVSAGGFTQVPNVVLNSPNMGFAAKTVYAKLLSYAWNNHFCFPGLKRMAEELGCGVSTVGDAIQELTRHGWVEVTRRGQGKTNLYKLKYVVPKR
jgi:hypothetical protein